MKDVQNSSRLVQESLLFYIGHNFASRSLLNDLPKFLSRVSCEESGAGSAMSRTFPKAQDIRRDTPG